MYRLELVGISKQYPAVKANDGVGLRVKPGEIHAVLGDVLLLLGFIPSNHGVPLCWVV